VKNVRSLRLLVCVMAVVGLLNADAAGWTIGHESATKAALETLPSWVEQIWRAEKTALIKTYSTYPDNPEKHNDLGDYMFEYKGRKFQFFPFESIDRNRARCHAGFSFYYEKIRDKIRAGDMKSAAKLAGCFTNIMQNAGGPRYGLDGPNGLGGHDFPTGFPLLMQFYPPPPEKAHVPAPLVLDGTYGDQSGQARADIPGYKPRLLGATPAEAAFYTYERYWDQLLSARGHVCNIIEAYYADDVEGIRQHMSIMVKESARVTADIIYTATCMAKGRFSAAEVERFKVVSLVDVTPSYKPTYMPPARLYSHFPVIEDANLNMKRELVPLTLLMKKSGKVAPVEFKRGFGSGCGSSMTMYWNVPADVFSEFRITVGLNAKLESGRKIRMLVKYNEATVYDSGPVTNKEPAKEVVVDVSRGGKLTLRAIRVGKGYAVNHLVWGNPVLFRKSNLPGPSEGK